MQPHIPGLRAVLAFAVLAASAGAQTLVEDQRLFEAALTAGDELGAAVSVSGARIAVGAPRADLIGSLSGAAYVYVASGAGWVKESDVAPFGLAPNDEFGTSIDIDGTRLVVGAPGADVNFVSRGAAYVFERQGNGSWLQVAQLSASEGTVGDAFGSAVSLSGDRVIVGAPEDDPDGIGASGSAYVFERQGNGTWLEVAKLTSANAGAARRFGRRVEIDGAVAVIAQSLAGGAVGGDQIFVHRRVTSAWPLEDTIATPTGNVPGAADFASDISLSATRLLVSDPSTTPGGRAHLFEHQAGSWNPIAELLAAPLGNSAPVGRSVALRGDMAVLGGPGTNSLEGRAALFLRATNGIWRELASLQPNSRSGIAPDDCGRDVAIDDACIVVGAPRFTPAGPAVASGSAFAFRRGQLMHGHTTVRVTGGEQQDFLLLAGPANGFKLHWIVGSASGTTPGVMLSPSITAPLNIDNYALQTISSTNSPPILGSLGLLDIDGVSKRTLIVPPGLEPSLAGLTLHHAYLIFEPLTFDLIGVSNAVPLTLVP
jgi:hypothetical protein